MLAANLAMRIQLRSRRAIIPAHRVRRRELRDLQRAALVLTAIRVDEAAVPVDRSFEIHVVRGAEQLAVIELALQLRAPLFIRGHLVFDGERRTVRGLIPRLAVVERDFAGAEYDRD